MGTPNEITEVGICNLALSRMGSVSGIQSLDTTVDTSTEAAQCAIWYPQDRDALLTDWPWNWTRGSAVLAQVNTTYPATPEWQYSYRYPVDCLSAIRVVPTCPPQPAPGTIPQTTGIGGPYQVFQDRWWKRPEGEPWPWSFNVESDSVGRLIVTDLPNAVLLYTRALSDPTQFGTDFVDLLAWRLAMDLAVALAISPARQKLCSDGYRAFLMKTRARFGNEQQTGIPKRTPSSILTSSRWGGWGGV
jgi:hypothetical protein